MRVSEDLGQGAAVPKELSLPLSSSQSILEAALTPSPKHPATVNEGISSLSYLLGALLHARLLGRAQTCSLMPGPQPRGMSGAPRCRRR